MILWSYVGTGRMCGTHRLEFDVPARRQLSTVSDSESDAGCGRKLIKHISLQPDQRQNKLYRPGQAARYPGGGGGGGHIKLARNQMPDSSEPSAKNFAAGAAGS